MIRFHGNSVEMVEVGPRDGLQMDPGIVPTATKIELITRLLATGLRRIEVTSFVNPRRSRKWRTPNKCSRASAAATSITSDSC